MRPSNTVLQQTASHCVASYSVYWRQIVLIITTNLEYDVKLAMLLYWVNFERLFRKQFCSMIEVVGNKNGGFRRREEKASHFIDQKYISTTLVNTARPRFGLLYLFWKRWLMVSLFKNYAYQQILLIKSYSWVPNRRGGDVLLIFGFWGPNFEVSKSHLHASCKNIKFDIWRYKFSKTFYSLLSLPRLRYNFSET